jgi:hypothetical protein
MFGCHWRSFPHAANTQQSGLQIAILNVCASWEWAELKSLTLTSVMRMTDPTPTPTRPRPDPTPTPTGGASSCGNPR